jgi:hypothetical protein
MMEAVLAGYAQMENDIRKQRCTAGMRGALRKGLYIWDSKFGYKRPKKSSKRVTEPDIFDEPRASLLRRGMQLYSEGNTSLSELESIVRTVGVYSPRTGKAAAQSNAGARYLKTRTMQARSLTPGTAATVPRSARATHQHRDVQQDTRSKKTDSAKTSSLEHKRTNSSLCGTLFTALLAATN